MTLQTGELFADKYRVLDKLGEGGFGAVYRVEIESLKGIAGDGGAWQVALKVLNADFAAHPDMVQRFLREMALARDLVHENGVPIRDTGVWQHQVFYTMELVEGRTLDSVISSGELIAPRRLVAWGLQGASFLRHLHERNHIHRDIKPANLMLEAGRGQERIRVLDLGIARRLHDDQAVDLTQGAFIGTPRYAAPEYLIAGEVSESLDIYALGLVLYECACGSPAFPGVTFSEIQRQVQVFEPPPLWQEHRHIPEPLGRLIARCIAKDPAERVATAAELQRELLTIERDIGQRSVAGPTVPHRPGAAARGAEPTGSRLGVWLALLLVLVAGGGGGAWWWLQREATDPSDPTATIPTDPAVVRAAAADGAKPVDDDPPPADDPPAPDDAEPRPAVDPDPAVSGDPDPDPVDPPATEPEVAPTPPPPTIALDAPAEAAVIARTVDIRGRASGEPPLRLQVGAGEPLDLAEAGEFTHRVDLADDAATSLSLVVTDRLGREARIERRIRRDLDGPQLAAPLVALVTVRDLDVGVVEVVADEPLDPAATTIDGRAASVDGARARLEVSRGEAAERRIPIELVDALGNRTRFEVTIRAARVPAGLETIDGRTGLDGWGLGFATPLREPISGLEFAFIPPTDAVDWDFVMGAPDGDAAARDDERPRHRVRLSRPFYASVVEVPVATWRAVAADDAVLRDRLIETSWALEQGSAYDRYPAVGMSRTEAESWCGLIGARLPTEAEWEWCARLSAGASDTLYPWPGGPGAATEFANYHREGEVANPVPAASGRPLPFTGLRQLLGNVAELCADGYADRVCGLAESGAEPLVDPFRPPLAPDEAAVARGGSYKKDDLRAIPVISRRFRIPSVYSDVGFRCVVDAER